MARRPQDVTDAELEVLRALWELGPATIRTLADRLYPRGGASEYATVQKLLERLEDKGHVKQRLPVFFFRHPAVTQFHVGTVLDRARSFEDIATLVVFPSRN